MSNSFFFIGGYNYFTKLSLLSNLKIYSGKPDTPFKFNSDKNLILRRENLKTKESSFRQILNRTRTNYYLKNGNI